MLVMLISAFLPLIFAASVGPEAGLTDVIVGLCYWVGDNIKYAKEHEREYSEVGEAVTLGVLSGFCGCVDADRGLCAYGFVFR